VLEYFFLLIEWKNNYKTIFPEIRSRGNAGTGIGKFLPLELSKIEFLPHRGIDIQP